MKGSYSIGETVLVLSNNKYHEAKIIHIQESTKDRIGWAECKIEGDAHPYRYSFLHIKKYIL